MRSGSGDLPGRRFHLGGGLCRRETFDHCAIALCGARVLERYGAAVVITEAEATGKKIYDTACQLLQDPAKLQEMGAKARSLAKTDAVEQIYQGICQLLA